MSKEYPLTV